MNFSQNKYIEESDDISLKTWGALTDVSDPDSLDQIWTSVAMNLLKHSERQSNRDAYNRISRLCKQDRMRIWEELRDEQDHSHKLRPIASEQTRIVASEITRSMNATAAAKEKFNASSSNSSREYRQAGTPLESSSANSAANNEGVHAKSKKRLMQETGIQHEASPSPRKKTSRLYPKNLVKKCPPKTFNPKMKIKEPWKILMDCAICMHSDWDVELPSETQIDMDKIGSDLRRILFNIALKNLWLVQDLRTKPGYDKFRCLRFKDAFTAMSGIWNLYSQDENKQFGEALVSEAKKICEMPQLEEHLPQISHIVAILKGSADTAKGLLSLTYELQRSYAQNSEEMRFITMVQHISPTRWRGETGSSATAISKSALADVYGVGKEARKCDCLLTVDGLEIANFEAKRKGTGTTDLAIQLRKNSKIAKSIALELDHLGVDHPPILNIHGNTALISKLGKFKDDIYVVGRCASAIVLPELETELDMFLDHGIYVLWNLLMYFECYAQDVFKKKRKYDYKQRSEANEATVTAKPKFKEEYLEWQKVVFHTPTKPSTKPTETDVYISLLECEDGNGEQAASNALSLLPLLTPNVKLRNQSTK
ncbi:hypothetical protein BGX21_010638 [Mortierella sp. AD011]|nr:hypothetical protein BGX21_010638 [Mortierella sp. AD011]